MVLNYSKKFRIISLALLCLVSCTKEDTNDLKDSQNQKSTLNATNLINFKGLKVVHRFNTPLIKANSNTNSVAKNFSGNQVAQSIPPADFEEFLDYEDEILSSVDEQLNDFPYSDNDEENLDMIRKDFPDMTDEEISENIEVIEDYYAMSLDHTVSNDLQENKSKLKKGGKKNIGEDFIKFTCVNAALFLHSRGHPLSYTLGLAAIHKSLKAKKEAGESIFKVFNSQNTQRDAYRHLIWSAYLSKYYLSIFSVTRRLEFAKLVGDLNEFCSLSNSIDSKSMDFHNNRIGRKIFADNTSRRKVFGITIGLNRPSDFRIREVAIDIVLSGKFVNKNNEGLRRSEILNTNRNTSVYFSQKDEYDDKVFTKEDEYLVGDWNGDGKDNIAVRRASKILMDFNFDSTIDKSFIIGNGNDENEYLVGDWNNNGVDNIGFRRGKWVLLDFNFDLKHDKAYEYGYGDHRNDQYLVGDWNGDGVDDIAVRGKDHIAMDFNSGGVQEKNQYIGYGDHRDDEYLVGDWDGNGTDNIAIRRGNEILMDYNFNGDIEKIIYFGYGDERESQYLVGDWNGDGKDNIAVRRGRKIIMSNFDGSVYGEFNFGYGD